MSQVTLRALRKSFGANAIIPNIDLDVPAGKLTVLLGPSGCGKSTLLRLITGLETPDSGTIWLGERDITGLAPRERNMAMVFQNYALYPHLTVRENLAFPLQVARVDRRMIDDKVAATADLLGIKPLLDRLPRTLSGGERQRTAVGRAIIRDPVLFLFDEPLSNLDFQLRNQMRGELRSLQQRLGKTAIYVTHDQTEAMTMADQLVVLNKGEIMQIGAPEEIYDRPANLFVAGFIGSPPLNKLQVKAAAKKLSTIPDGIELIPNIDIADGEYTLGVRPDHLLAAGAEANIPLLVERIEYHGAASYALGRIGGQFVMARLGCDASLSAKSVAVALNPKHIHLFDQRQQRVETD